jgi:hypothetical protein
MGMADGGTQCQPLKWRLRRDGRAMQKTGMRSQAGLVALMASLVNA